MSYQRIFPFAHSDVHDGEGASAGVDWHPDTELRAIASRLVAVVPTTDRQRSGALDKVLSDRRRALEREATGAVQAADFFWLEMVGGLERLWRRPAALNKAIKAAFAGWKGDIGAAQLGDSMIRDVFVEPLLLIMRGLDPSSTRGERLGEHVKRLLALISGTAWAAEVAAALDLRRAEHHFATDRLSQAERWFLATAKAARDAGNSERADALIAHAVACVRAAGLQLLARSSAEAASPVVGLALQSAIGTLGTLRQSAAHLLGTYHALSELNCALAVTKAVASEHAAAARAVRAARIFDPSSQSAAEISNQLNERIAKLRAEFARVLAQSPSGVVLSAEGIRIQSDLREAERINNDLEPRPGEVDVIKAYGQASDRALWRAAGGAAGDTVEIEVERGAALGRVLAANPGPVTGEADASATLLAADPAAIERAMAAEPALAVLDVDQRRAVGTFVAAALSGTATPAAQTAALATVVPTLEAVTAPATPIETPREHQSGAEPLGAWLRSRRSRGAKTALAASMVALIAAVGAVAYDFHAASERQGHYGSAASAVQAGDWLKAREAIAAFKFSATPVLAALRGTDPLAQAIGVLDVGVENALKAPDRDKALRSAEASFAAGDSAATLSHIAAFRAALHHAVQEPRAAAVDRLEVLAKDIGARRIRDEAAAGLLKSLAAGQAAAAISAGETFQRNISRDVEDPRAPAVRELLAIARDHEPLQARDRALAQMQSGLDSGDVEQVLVAGTRFMDGLTSQRPDPRVPEVRREMERAIVKALIGGDHRLDESIAAAAKRLEKPQSGKN